MNQSNDSFKNFVNNHKFTFVTGIASLLGLALGLVVFFPPHKRPFYSVKSFNLINDSSSTIENLDIKYKVCKDKLAKENCQLENIQSLTVTRILFWNGGRTKIDKTDVDDNPITIVASGKNKILEAKLLHSSNERTDFRLNQKINTINFNFLELSNGGVIQVLHTGLSDEDIALNGYVEDYKFRGKIKLVQLEDYREKIGWFYSIGYLLLMGASLRILDNLKNNMRFINKIEESNSFFYILYTLFEIFFVMFIVTFIYFRALIFLVETELFFDRLILRYPLSSYRVFVSEINN